MSLIIAADIGQDSSSLCIIPAVNLEQDELDKNGYKKG